MNISRLAHILPVNTMVHHRWLLFFFTLFISCSGPADVVLTGKVVKIADGDTFTFITAGKKVRVRLYGIDCPERGQPFSKVAKRFLSDRVGNKWVQVVQQDEDRYGRIVGIVFADGVNINEELLAAGLAWHYKAYDDNPDWARLEEEAREKKLGLWADGEPVNPRVWRKRRQ